MKESLKYVFDKLLPNGFGIKGTLALMVAAYALQSLPPEKLYELALLVFTAYFTIKAVNGGSK